MGACMKNKIVMGIVAALLSAAGACSGSSRVEVEGSFGPAVFRVHWEYNSATGEATIVGPEGLALCVEFLDEDGETLGETSVTIPGTIPVPDRTEAFQFKDCSEEEEDEEEARLAGIEGRDAFPIRPTATSHVFFGGPVEVAANRPLRQHSLIVRDMDPARAEAKRDRIVQLGPDARAPLGVDVLVWAEATVEPLAGLVTLKLANPSAFEDVTIEINGRPGAASIEDATSSYSKGWNVLTFVFPLEMFETSVLPGTFTNSWRVEYHVESNPDLLFAAGSVDLVN